ncbi:MAG: PfkB family carbohydrate kinase, partial [Rhodoglobus sp.]|nr:PfkB family carbohydrate kinase [Rhodoglobus sp.]
MSTSARVGVAGHVCLDLTPALDREPGLAPGLLYDVGAMSATAGGCVANTGGQLADLGFDVSLFADVGDDALAAVLRDRVIARGLDPTGFRVTPGSTSYSIVVQAPDADRTFWHHVGANDHFDGSRIDVAGLDLLHVGYPSILPALVAADGGPLVALFARARAATVVTSLDLAVVSNPDDASRELWRSRLAAILQHTDIVTPSVDDLTSATGMQVELDSAGLIAAAQKLVAQGAAIATVSAGERGIALATGTRTRFAEAGPLLATLAEQWSDQAIWIPALTVETRVTTTGAGDAATA